MLEEKLDQIIQKQKELESLIKLKNNPIIDEDEDEIQRKFICENINHVMTVPNIHYGTVDFQLSLVHNNFMSVTKISDKNLKWFVDNMDKLNTSYSDTSIYIRVMTVFNFYRFYKLDRDYFFETVNNRPEMLLSILDKAHIFPNLKELVIKLIEKNYRNILHFENHETFYTQFPDYKIDCQNKFITKIINHSKINGSYNLQILSFIENVNLTNEIQDHLLFNFQHIDKTFMTTIKEIIKYINNPSQKTQDVIMENYPQLFSLINNPSVLTKDKYIKYIDGRIINPNACLKWFK